MRYVLPALMAVGLFVSCKPDSTAVSDGVWSTSIGIGPPTVIVVHGGPGLTHRYLRPEWDRLADSVRVVYYDQRGCGLSERTDSVSWQQHVDDLDSLVEEMSSDGSVHLAGSSWGSVLATLYALRKPGRIGALILSGVPGKEFWPVYPWVVQAKDASCTVDTDSTVIYGDSTICYRADSVVMVTRLVPGSFTVRVTRGGEEIKPDTAVLDSAAVAASDRIHPVLAARMGMSCPGAAAATWRSVAKIKLSVDELSSIDVPVLVIRGTEESPVGDWGESLGALLGRATVESLDHAGHEPWLDRPDEFFDLVHSFLTEQDLAGNT